MPVTRVYLHSSRVTWFVIAVCACISAQTAPITPDRPWTSPYEQQIRTQNQSLPTPKFTIDSAKAYSLPELVDLAEQRNPETRFAWERAKAQAAALGIAKSEWYPVIGAIADGQVDRFAILFDVNSIRQTVSTSDLAVGLDYTILDFGRSSRIESAAAQLLATDFGFNDAHRRVIYQVEEAYYRVLSTASQQLATEANLANAQAVQQAAQDRLDHGLATRPDVLEAQERHGTGAIRSAISHRGAGNRSRRPGRRTWHCGVGRHPDRTRHFPHHAGQHGGLGGAAHQPRVAAAARSAAAGGRTARPRSCHQASQSGLLPDAQGRRRRRPQYLYGFQEQLPAVRTSLFAGTALASLNWTIFDGGARRSAVTAAEANSRAASAQIDITRNQIADEVWRAYSNVKTAFRQREAATALLKSADESYNAALEAYNYGVRNLLDVTAAQRALAQARTADISAQTQVLTTLADLAFRTGDLLHSGARPGKP